MNAWFDRYLKALGAEDTVFLPEEARLILDLAGETAHTSGARQFAPLASYLAGRAAAGMPPQGRFEVLGRAKRAAAEAGEAGGDLGLD